MTYDEAIAYTKLIYTAAITVKRNIMQGPEVPESLLVELFPNLFGPLDIQAAAAKMLAIERFEPQNLFNLAFLASREDLIKMWFIQHDKIFIEPDIRWMKGFSEGD